MDKQHTDGSAGDFDYAIVGNDYSRHRRPDQRIAARIEALLGDACHVLNVGAGAGSYEPTDRDVVAVEPSASMRARRPAGRPAVDAVAEDLPFPDRRFDATMAIFTVHQWPDLAAGLAEMRRVTRGPVVVMTCDPAEVQRFWLNDYAPRVLAAEARRYPSLSALHVGMGGRVDVLPVPIPLHCSDGFNEAYYGRPERLLEPSARLACSSWSFVDAAVSQRYVEHLRSDLEEGRWDSKFGHLRTQSEFHGSLRLLVSRPAER